MPIRRGITLKKRWEEALASFRDGEQTDDLCSVLVEVQSPV